MLRKKVFKKILSILMVTIIPLILINLFLTSCYKNEFESKITENNSFWYIYEYDSINSSYKNINYGYKFLPNGEYRYMHFDFSANKLSEYKDILNDVKMTNEWTFDEESNLFIFNNWKYKVVYNSKDTIIIECINNSKKEVLINLGKKNPESFKNYMELN